MSKQKKPHRELNGPEKTGNTKNDPDREEWIIQEHREYGDPAGLRNILGDDYQILWEMKLESIPRLLSTPCTIESLVLVK